MLRDLAKDLAIDLPVVVSGISEVARDESRDN